MHKRVKSASDEEGGYCWSLGLRVAPMASISSMKMMHGACGHTVWGLGEDLSPLKGSRRAFADQGPGLNPRAKSLHTVEYDPFIQSQLASRN